MNRKGRRPDAAEGYTPSIGAGAPPQDPPPEEVRAGQGHRSLAGVILIVSLVVLAGTLFAVQRSVAALQEQVDDVADPAVDLIAEVQYLLARQTSALRGYVISGDTAYLEQYASFYQSELEIYPVLERYAAELSPVLAADVAEVKTLSDQWHRRLRVEVIAEAAATGATVDASVVLLEQELYRSTLEAATTAMAVARQMIRDRQARIEEVERNGRFVFGFLFLLAGLVAVFISRLNMRIRHLAAEAEGRRRQVELAMDRTERAVAERGYLMRGFTHDVKNPLNVADGYADLLELGYRGEVPPGQLELVGRIRAAIRDTVEIIDELLELSRVESGGLQVEPRAVDLRALASRIVHDHMQAAHRVGLDLQFVDEHARGVSTSTHTDPDRVAQVLKNLVLNALKYTPPPGSVMVRLSTSSGDADHDVRWARLAVIDSGPGIPLDEQERIFYEFHRVPGSTAGGHGLGLAISRRIARLLGGDVTVRSVPGHGATFELWLPAEAESEHAAPAPVLSTAGASPPADPSE